MRRPNVTEVDLVGGPEPTSRPRRTTSSHSPRTGCELRVREPGHRLVRTRARDVHVYEHGDPAVAAHLLLRDHLRADRAEARGRGQDV